MNRVKRIWYLSPMRAAKVQASLRIRAVSPEPSLLAHTSSQSSRILRQKARSLAPLNGWACAVKICHGGMLEDTNSLDGAQIRKAQIITLNDNVNKLEQVQGKRYTSSMEKGAVHIPNGEKYRVTDILAVLKYCCYGVKHQHKQTNQTIRSRCA